MMLGIPLNSKTRTEQLIEASHTLNIVDVLCRLGLFEGCMDDREAIISDAELRISFYE